MFTKIIDEKERVYFIKKDQLLCYYQAERDSTVIIFQNSRVLTINLPFHKFLAQLEQ